MDQVAAARWGGKAIPGPPSVHDFPDGFGAHWVRVAADHIGRGTALFRYTQP